MINAAVICEYNPFHSGHLRQLELIRARLGADAVITALMSGNFVQRGELACAPKYARAESAVRCGCDLVLELPFPWSCSSAEFFATAGVTLADSLGVFDALCFGCESAFERAEPPPGGPIGYTPGGPIGYTPEEDAAVGRFRGYLARRGSAAPSGRPERSAHGSKLREAESAYRERYGADAFYPTSPNDILAAEYIAALDRLGSPVKPLLLPRIHGLSATASRRAWERGDFGALARLVPPATAELCGSHVAPVSVERLGIALPMFFRLTGPSALAGCCDADGGLAERLCAAAQKSASPSELFSHAAARHLTSARIRRAALHCLLGTTYAEVEAPPPFTALLAANRRGTALLREIKKRSPVPVVTKPADYRALGPEAVRAFRRSVRADGVYTLASGSRDDPLRLSPYIAPDR